MEANLKKIRMYTDPNGKVPFDNWLKSIKDPKMRARIRARLDRLALGNYGDYKNLSDGVCELRLHFGSGVRIYYTELEEVMVILLCGGDKRTQNRDIEKAKLYKEVLEESYYEKA